MRRKRDRPQNEGYPPMPEVILPCYGGPYDGKYFPQNKPPIGYREFPVRSRMIYLWKTIKVERLDFNTLEKASRRLPSQFDSEDIDEIA